MLWTEKYRPHNMDEVLGNKKAQEEIREWVEAWEHGEIPKPMLLVGPPGTGKTTIAHIIAKEFADHVELNASDKRSYDILQAIIGEASTSSSLFGQGLKLIILDEVDGLHGNEDRGGIRAITHIIKESRHPLILLANDPYSQRIRSLKTKCQVITIRKVHTNSIVALMKRICAKEGVKFEEHVLRTLAKRSRGDLRSAINDLEMMARGRDSITSEDLDALAEKDVVNKIFDSVRTVLKSKNPRRIRDALRLEEDPAFILEQVTENIPREYEKAEEIVRAYDMVAEADLYLGRAFHTRHYGYWKYSYDLMGLGVALAKEETYKKFSRYASSTFYSQLSKNRAKRDLRDQVASKIGSRLHTSHKVAIEQFPYFEIMFQPNDQARELADYFNLDDAEVKQFRTRKIPKPKKAKKKGRKAGPSDDGKSKTQKPRGKSTSSTSKAVPDKKSKAGRKKDEKNSKSSISNLNSAEKGSKSDRIVTESDKKVSSLQEDQQHNKKSDHKEKEKQVSLFSFHKK